MSRLRSRGVGGQQGGGGWHLVVGVDDVRVDVFAGAVRESLAPALHEDRYNRGGVVVRCMRRGR